MPLPGQSFGTADRHNSVEPLPLFRPEAIAAQQQKFYGEIILIRPFSLLLLSWFAVGITSAVLGFLLLGHYTERAHVSGVIAVSPAANANASAENLEAFFFVPGRLIGQLHPGSQLTLRCAACSAPFSQQTGTVLEVPDAPLGPAELSQAEFESVWPDYRSGLQSSDLQNKSVAPATGGTHLATQSFAANGNERGSGNPAWA